LREQLFHEYNLAQTIVPVKQYRELLFAFKRFVIFL